MKRKLLFGIVLMAGQLTAQSLTQTNEPTIGMSNTMFLCDSNTTNLSSVTGSGVTWDYTGLNIYTGMTNNVDVTDATTSTYASEFPGAVKMMSIGTKLHSYISSSATERNSHGFVYTDASLGDVRATWNSDLQLAATYPFTLGEVVNDVFSGQVISSLASATANGTSRVTVDGVGTMLFPFGVTINDVLRYHLVDTATANFGFPIGEIKLIRSHYEYFDHSAQDLPIFIHSKLIIYQGTSLLGETSLVLSDYAGNFVGLSENQAEVKFSVYPNPVYDELMVAGDFKDANLVITNLNGQEVLSMNGLNGLKKINVEELSEGFYLVRITQDGVSSVKRITIR